MISRPIVPVELKIVGILKHLNTERQSSLETLLADYAALKQQIGQAPLGAVLREMDAIQKQLDETDFLLACALESTVTPEMRKKTPRYQRWCAHPDPEFNRLREELAALMADYYRLRDGIEEGKGSAAAQKELPELKKRVEQVIPAIQAWVRKHPEKIHDPYR